MHISSNRLNPASLFYQPRAKMLELNLSRRAITATAGFSPMPAPAIHGRAPARHNMII
jgi:hypothetical protein